MLLYFCKGISLNKGWSFARKDNKDQLFIRFLSSIINPKTTKLYGNVLFRGLLFR